MINHSQGVGLFHYWFSQYCSSVVNIPLPFACQIPNGLSRFHCFTNQTCLDHWVPNMNVDLHGKLNNCASCSANFTKGENHGIREVRGCSTKVWQHRHTANISMSASRLVILSRVWRLLAWWFLWFQFFVIPHNWKQLYKVYSEFRSPFKVERNESPNKASIQSKNRICWAYRFNRHIPFWTFWATTARVPIHPDKARTWRTTMQ